MHLSRNTLIFSIVTCLLAAGGYAYVFLELRSASQERESISTAIENEKTKESQRGAIEALLETTEEDRRSLALALVSDETFVNFFEEFEVLENEAGVTGEIEEVRESVPLGLVVDPANSQAAPKESPAAGILEYAELDVSATGSWSQVFRFLSLIETMPYALDLKSVRIMRERSVQTAPGAEGPETVLSPVWELAFTIQVLKYK